VAFRCGVAGFTTFIKVLQSSCEASNIRCCSVLLIGIAVSSEGIASGEAMHCGKAANRSKAQSAVASRQWIRDLRL